MAAHTSSEEDAVSCSKSPIPCKKGQKKGDRQCYMHLKSVGKEPAAPFTRVRWDTYRKCVKAWPELSGDNKVINATYAHCINTDFNNIPVDAGFHPTCYRRFIDKKRIDSARKQLSQSAAQQTQGQDGESPWHRPVPLHQVQEKKIVFDPSQACLSILQALCFLHYA